VCQRYVYDRSFINKMAGAEEMFLGYQLLIDVAGMPKAYQHLLVRLRLEQARLINWGEKVDLVEDQLDQPSRILHLHRNLILDILVEMQVAFKLCLKTSAKYGPISSTSGSIVKPEKEKRTILQRTMAILDKAPTLAQGLQWAMVDQEKFTSLVNRLIGYNDSIESLLDRTSLEQLQMMQKQSHIAVLQLTGKVDELMVLARAFNLQAPNQEVPGLSRSSTIVDDQSTGSSTSSRLAVFKAEQTALEAKNINGASFSIDPRHIIIQDEDNVRPTANYQHTAVWIEWKEYDGHLGPESAWNKMVAERVQKLAILLASKSTPPEFHAPYCLGYFDGSTVETDRFGLVYGVPCGAAGGTGPISLRQRLRTGIAISLNERIALAHAIAQSLMYLHSVSWLHKSVRSDNVLFFPDSSTKKLNFNQPILSGFGYARPDDPGAETEQHSRRIDQDLYRPPDCQSMSYSRSKKSHDIYALGIVLLELAYWKPVELIVDIDLEKKGARKAVRNLRDTLLSENEGFLQRIREHAGDTFAQVVQRCLTGGSEIGIPQGHANSNEEDPTVGTEMYKIFSEDIVGNLASIRL
jgi:Prion-inhibition and propagation/Protein tyrosine and serine/threonine kinase